MWFVSLVDKCLKTTRNQVSRIHKLRQVTAGWAAEHRDVPVSVGGFMWLSALQEAWVFNLFFCLRDNRLTSEFTKVVQEQKHVPLLSQATSFLYFFLHNNKKKTTIHIHVCFFLFFLVCSHVITGIRYAQPVIIADKPLHFKSLSSLHWDSDQPARFIYSCITNVLLFPLSKRSALNCLESAHVVYYKS